MSNKNILIVSTSTVHGKGYLEYIDTEIKNFLNKVWPFRGVLIGDSSEGDYAFVTYVHNELDNQHTPTQIVDNIYTYTRIQLGTGEPSSLIHI